ncbi:citrate synthase [Kribbella italica]|uniref:citrate synthase (unknown stereospecificity) n=1 Tax=Kribbella italica TaxID=1540520 RepID=A0A7W9J6X1_9ACTN|nr:citrate synthase [Kribbella italica]
MPDPSDEHYLTTAEVAARLKVKPETVYAYVSRGLLTSTRARGRRGSLFVAAEVARLAGRTVDHPGAIERIESQLTLITEDDLYYRGHRVRDLTTTHTVESVATLLWTGTLPTPTPPSAPPGAGAATGVGAGAGAGVGAGAGAGVGAGPVGFPAPVDEVGLARRAMGAAPAAARLTDKLRIAVAVLGAGDPLRYDLSPQAVVLTARRLLGVLVTALSGPDTDSSQTFGSRLRLKLAPNAAPKLAPGAAPLPELLDAAVILLADHGLAVSTIAARVAASSRANLYAVISAGLGALDGHLHGAAPTLAYDFLGRALDDPTKALSDQLRSGEPVPGFGHTIYQERDPRAEVLLGMLGDHPVVATVEELTARVPSFPNSDLALAAVLHAHDLPGEAGEALFAIARMIGWTAHALEEYAAPPLRFRTLGVYTGPETSTD